MTDKTNTAVSPKKLRATMTAVLSARSRLNEAKASHSTASGIFDRHYELAFSSSSPPPTSEVVEVEAFLTELEGHHLRHQQALKSRLQEEVKLTLAEMAWVRVTNQLAEEVAHARNQPELKSDRVFTGATRMSELAKPPKKTVDGSTTAPKEVEELVYSAELSALEEALRKAILDLTTACARAMKLAPRLKDARNAIGKFSHPDIQFPVRPTEEEVQRFLQEAEQFMIARLEAHRLVISLLTKRSVLIELLEVQRRELGARLKAFRQLLEAEAASSEPVDARHWIPTMIEPPDPWEDPDDSSEDPEPEPAPLLLDVETEAFLEFSKLVFERFADSAKAALGDDYDTSKLDSARVPNAGLSDRGKIDELRKLMHTFATACGHDNEAKTALKDAENITKKTVEVKGVGQHAKNWQECLDWREEIERRQEEASRHNESRHERINLLEESVAQYEKQRAHARRILHRFVITIIAPHDQPAADELRILTNAAAWMANPSDEVSEGGYPVY